MKCQIECKLSVLVVQISKRSMHQETCVLVHFVWVGMNYFEAPNSQSKQQQFTNLTYFKKIKSQYYKEELTCEL